MVVAEEALRTGIRLGGQRATENILPLQKAVLGIPAIALLMLVRVEKILPAKESRLKALAWAARHPHP